MIYYFPSSFKIYFYRHPFYFVLNYLEKKGYEMENQLSELELQEKQLKEQRKKRRKEWIQFFWLALLALTIRSCAFEPYNIPSSSMVPTLLIGTISLSVSTIMVILNILSHFLSPLFPQDESLTTLPSVETLLSLRCQLTKKRTISNVS